MKPAAHRGNVRLLPVRPPRDETIALTVLASMTDYAALRGWCARVVTCGRPATPQDVVHALLARLLADPELAADVAADLREGAGADVIADYVCW